jgi:hypothetical protein
MGCDIHMYVQYREKKERENELNRDWWYEFGDQISPGRNYSMFGILAGVRSSYYDDEGVTHLEPKGLPDFGLGWGARADLSLSITETGQEEKSCTLEQAERWKGPIEKNKDGKPVRTEHPDWHSHSWLTPKELAQVYRWYKKETGYPPGLEYRVLLKMMKALEDEGKNEVVVVFWFDN